MDKISTKKLLLYLFNETEMTDSVLIQHAIDYNYFIAEEFKEMKDTIDHLDDLLMIPKKSTIENILSYSKSYRKSAN
jgi:hypothetical protein